tara:strand:+ start:1213 stop:2253 length:1041 start_codon:yes stop_codon:yes gene_type:complete
MGLSVTNFNIENASGQAVRQDIEACFLALQGLNAETSDLSAGQTVQGMWFLRSDTKDLKIKKSTTGFTTVGNIDQPNLGLLPKTGGTLTGQLLADDAGTAAAPALGFDTDTDTGLFRSGANELGVSTGGVERWSFLSDGSLITHGRTIANSLTTYGATFYVNGSNFNGLALVKNQYNWGTPLFIHLLDAANSSTLPASGYRNILEIQWNTGSSGTGTAVGGISTNGTTTNYATSSDYRLKENAVSISDGITRLKTLKPYRFNWKSDSSKTVDGFFAHEVTAVPEAIIGTKDQVELADDDMRGVKKGDPVYQSIDESKLVPLLVAALQEAVVKIETLETKVAALEGS